MLEDDPLLGFLRGLDRVLEKWGKEAKQFETEHNRQVELLETQPELKRRMAALLSDGKTTSLASQKISERHIQELETVLKERGLGRDVQ